MNKSRKKDTEAFRIEKPQYITVNDITYAQGGFLVRTLQAGSETGYNLPGNKRWKNLSLHPLDLWRRMADDG